MAPISGRPPREKTRASDPVPLEVPLGAAGFDGVAASYDATFTKTAIGRAQRKLVWRYLDRLVQQKCPVPARVLELNCGTGEDAIHLAKIGAEVLATDASPSMLAVAKAKLARCGSASGFHSESIRFDTLALQSIPAWSSQWLSDGRPRFDLVLSNFGGLNCIDPAELAEVAKGLAQVVSRQGHVLAVVMSRSCVWEQAYFLAKGRPQEAFRRKARGPLQVPLVPDAPEERASDVELGPGKSSEENLEENSAKTWYYTPKELVAAFSPWFELRAARAVGLAVPPSYLEPVIGSKPLLMRALSWFDSSFGQAQLLASRGDHFLVNLVLAGTVDSPRPSKTNRDPSGVSRTPLNIMPPSAGKQRGSEVSNWKNSTCQANFSGSRLPVTDGQ